MVRWVVFGVVLLLPTAARAERGVWTFGSSAGAELGAGWAVREEQGYDLVDRLRLIGVGEGFGDAGRSDLHVTLQPAFNLMFRDPLRLSLGAGLGLLSEHAVGETRVRLAGSALLAFTWRWGWDWGVGLSVERVAPLGSAASGATVVVAGPMVEF